MNVTLPPGRYYGDRRSTQQFPGLQLTENSYAPAFVIPRHAHESAFFGMVIQGGYRENYDTRSRECTPDTLIFHPAGELHAEEHHDVVVRIFSIEPTRQLLERVRDYSVVLDRPQVFHAGPLVRLATRLYAEFRENNPIADLAMEGLTLELLAAACRHREAVVGGSPPPWLRKARDPLNDQSLAP